MAETDAQFSPDPRVPAPVSVRERRRGVTTGAEHTRVPNQLLDLVLFRLPASEQACLLYILRRTYGFANPTVTGERKQWDRVAISQFVSGAGAGGYVLDIGTNLSKPAVVKALQGLEQKGLVRVSYECPTIVDKGGRSKGCGWNESDDDHLTRPELDPRTKAFKCPRCGRTLSKAYALRTLTPGFIKRFLTQTDSEGRDWGYDPKVGRFYVGKPMQRMSTQSAEPSVKELREQLWFPELVDKIIGQAASANKSGQIAESRISRGFYQPILRLQQQGLPREAVEYGLQEVVKRKVAANKRRSDSWPNYCKACAETWLSKKYGSTEAASAHTAAAELEAELRRCADLNEKGERERARQLLHDLVAAHLDRITAEFGNDRALARRHLLESFKRGVEDYRSVTEYPSVVDYLPEWSWEADEARSRA